MPSKRLLKKEVRINTEYMLDDLVFLSQYAPKEKIAELEELINRAITLEVSTLSNLSHKRIAETGCTKKHFATLRQNYEKEVKEIETQVHSLTDSLIAGTK